MRLIVDDFVDTGFADNVTGPENASVGLTCGVAGRALAAALGEYSSIGWTARNNRGACYLACGSSHATLLEIGGGLA